MSKRELDQLYLTKNERTGILMLLVLLSLLVIVPWLYSDSEISDLKNTEEYTVRITPIENAEKQNKNSATTHTYNSNFDSKISTSKEKYELFDFDPNRLSAEDARRLGIQDKSFKALKNYLATGAKIYTAEQLKKIYGLDQNTYERIKPLVKIIPTKATTQIKSNYTESGKKAVNINSAIAEDLIPLPGIGEKLANRIIKYRNLLGGFTNKSQLKEIYGLQDSSIQKFQDFISLGNEIKKINLNTIPCDSLKKHPYFSNGKARVICEYRKQHPKIQTLNDLYHIEALDSNWISRIKDYLNFE